MAEKPTPSYRWAAFTHWANLGLLAAGGLAGATVDPSLWALLLPAQALVLWLVPDLPPFRRSVEKDFERTQREAERAYYLEQLWGLTPLPKPGGLKGLFVSASEVPVDERVVVRSNDFERYLEMRDIVRKLDAMVPLANGRVTPVDIERLEVVIIGYLRLLIACRPLGRAVSEIDAGHLESELKDIARRLEGADGALRAVLLERKRLLDEQLKRLPRMRATLELMRARAEAIPHQIRSLHSQVLTEPGTGVHAILDQMIERNEMLRDPLGDLEADEAVREFLAQPASVTPIRRAPAKVAGKR